jgi:hypothetical protein
MRQSIVSGAASLLLSVSALSLAGAADARCLASKRPIQGQLAVMRLANHTGQGLKGYQIELAHPACAEATGLEGAPVRLDGVRTVQILTSDDAGERKLDSLIGEKIVVAGYVDVPDPERHTGDAVLSNAWLIAVPSTGEGVTQAALTADDGQADDADESETTGPKHTEIATLNANGEVSAYQPPQNPNVSDIEARLARFVTQFYLSGENVSPDVLRGIYAAKVNYFGKTGTPLAKIVRDKLNYYARWPSREFTLQPGTLAIRPMRGPGRVYELTFVYDFKVASATKRTGGTGYARLQVDLTEGRGKIVRETGKVIDRY